MAFRIYDEYELEQFMNKGLSPAPIVVSKGTGYSIVNYTFARGEFVNVLTSANQDYLSLDSVFMQPDNSVIELVVDVLNDAVSEVVSSNGTFSNYITLSFGSLFFQLGAVSGTILAGQLLNGKHTISIRRGVGQTFASADGGVEELVTGAGDPVQILYLARLTTFISSVNVYNFSLDGETFSLNEPSGAVFTGDLGTTGLRNTSSLDPNYIDDVMIQPYTL